MTTPIVVPVTPQAQPGADGPIYEAKLGDPQLDAIAAATKERMKGSMGVDEIRIDAPLRRAIREPAVDVDEEPFIGPTMPGIAAPPPTQHRYTIDVPSLAEGSVLKLGAPDTGRNLPDPGISGRTLTHVHLHATQVPTMLTLGEPTKVVLGDAAPQGTDDVLSKSRGFAAVTEGTAWIDAKEQLALVTRTGEASMRAIEGDLRLQADATNVELAAGQKVVIGAGDSVKIVATSGTDAQINGYQKPFGKSFFDGSWAFGSKEIMAAADVYTSVASLFKAFDEQESDYKKGNVSKEQTATDFAKNFVDAGKIVSTLVRYALGHSLGGQVKISAETFASITGGLAASVFGNLSASLTSPLSASVVGGTASMKGMAWSSVWAGLGVSIRTVRGKASLKSEQGQGEHLRQARRERHQREDRLHRRRRGGGAEVAEGRPRGGPGRRRRGRRRRRGDGAARREERDVGGLRRQPGEARLGRPQRQPGHEDLARRRRAGARRRVVAGAHEGALRAQDEGHQDERQDARPRRRRHPARLNERK
jgi:hypothetical protein